MQKNATDSEWGKKTSGAVLHPVLIERKELLKKSLCHLRAISFFELSIAFPLVMFKEGIRYYNKGAIRSLYFSDEHDCADSLVVNVSGYAVIISGKNFTPPVTHILESCFLTSCDCGAAQCVHRAVALLALWSALNKNGRSFKLEDPSMHRALVNEINLFLKEDAPEQMPGQVARPTVKLVSNREQCAVVMLKNLLICTKRAGDLKNYTQQEGCERISCTTQILDMHFGTKPWVAMDSSDISPYFKSPPHASANYYDPLESLEYELQYRFSDGTILSAHELIYHRYGVKVNKGLIPFNQSDNEIMGFAVNRFAMGYKSVETGMLSLLKNLGELKNDVGLFLVGGRNQQSERQGLRIDHVVFDTGPDAGFVCTLEARMEKTSAEGDVPEDDDDNDGAVVDDDDYGDPLAVLKMDQRPMINGCKVDGPFTKNFVYDCKSRALIFHRLDPLRAKILTLVGYPPSWFHYYGGEQSNDRTESVRVVIRTHDDAVYLYERLKKIEANNPAFKLHCRLKVYESQRMESFVKINSDASFNFWQKVLDGDDLGTAFCNGDPVLSLVVDSLRGGLWTILRPEEQILIQSNRKKTKKEDHKFFKHTGIAAVFWIELIGHVLALRDAQAKAAKASLAELDTQLWGRIAFVLGKEKGDPLSPDHGCSKKCVTLLQKVAHSCLKTLCEEQTGLWGGDGIIRIGGYRLRCLELIRHLMLLRVSQAEHGALKKPRIPLLRLSDTHLDSDLSVVHNGESNLPPENLQDIAFEGVMVKDLLTAFAGLKGQGFHVVYDGLSLEKITPDNFTSEFLLVETKGDPEEDSGAIDWFDLHPRFFLGGIEVDAKRVKALMGSGLMEWNGRIYYLDEQEFPSVSYLKRFWMDLESNKGGRAIKQDGVLSLPRNRTLDLLMLRKKGVKFSGGKDWQDICAFYDHLDNPERSVTPPDDLQQMLKPYQHLGVNWLYDIYRLRLGGILADDMGLGKTLQALALLKILKDRNEMKHVLVLVPTSLTYNWQCEVQKFTPDLPAVIFETRKKEEITAFLKEHQHALVICTYGLMVEHVSFFESHRWNIQIYDEAQSLKNITTLRTKTARSLASPFKLCMTGTPLENHLGEFYSLMDLVVPGALGGFDAFKKLYVNQKEIDSELMHGLRLKVKPLLLRRTKGEILKDLPPKTETVVVLPFEEKQRKIYRDIALSWNQKVRDSIQKYGEAKSQLMILTALLRLRQTCSDPSALPNISYHEEPPKIALLIDSLKEIVAAGHSALVFTQFINTYERILRQLKDAPIPCYALCGATGKRAREKQLDQFKTCEGGAVMLMTLKTGGMGLNLTKASYVFHVEPWWNPAVENQATDRTHRIGQNQSVQVYRYLMQDSVEQKIEILKKRKSQRFDALFLNTEQGDQLAETTGNIISQADFEFLLSV
ncbi:MAG: DEAD/DEAH box helicase [Deltaproteobacteria bacterium]|nr:DEAD/DEAH box helicase [Deltaproteobacteria bacterium]